MTWLVGQLNKKIEIRKTIQTPNSSGGFDETYVQLGSGDGFWAEVKVIAQSLVTNDLSGLTKPHSYIRGSQTTEKPTHTFKIRYSAAIEELGTLNPVKSEYKIFMHKGTDLLGKLFKVARCLNIDEANEFVLIVAVELEDRGTLNP